MIVYAAVILIIVLLRVNLDDAWVGDPDYDIETRYLKIVCAILVLLAGLRGSSVGADTISYIDDYARVRRQSFAQVLEQSGAIGAGYFWFSKAFTLTGLSVRWWLGTVVFFYVYAMYRFIQKYSRDKLVSILCFFTMGLYTFSLAGLKQTVAMGFTTLAYISLDDNRYIKAVILGILAYWCHSATAIFAFGLALYFLRDRNSYYPILIGFFILVLLVGDWLWKTSIGMLNNDHYSELYADADNLYSAWTFAFYLLLFVIMAFQWKRYAEDDPMEAQILYGMTVIAVAFQSLATSFSTAFRVAYYFLPFMTVLIPNCCNHCTGDSQKWLWKTGMCAICIFWMLYTGRNAVYTFFWQE